jgi:hypothetical protein
MKIISCAVFLFALACSNSGSNDVFTAESKEAGYEYIQADETVSEDDTFTPRLVPSDEIQEQKIIKTGRLTYETQDIEAAYTKIMQLAIQNKGLVQNDNSGKGYNRIFRNLVIRIPSENFQSFIDGVSEGVSYFDQKEISREDVSEEFVDLEARLKAKRELEKRYLDLLKQAKNVKDMLEIERELSNIREEIEAKQGRLQFLQNRVSMSTVNIEFYKLTSETGVTQSYGQKMINSLKGGWDGISVFFLGILYLWPLFLLILIGVLVLRKIIRRKKKS